MDQTQYDYIIAGAGCAGLSLAVHMIHSGEFGGKKILLVDREVKNKNDRTWCFWEKDAGLFEDVVYRRWNKLNVRSHTVSNSFSISPYTYKMIRGLDFYEYCTNLISRHPNFHFLKGDIELTGKDDERAFVQVGGNRYSAEYIFNSLMKNKRPDENGTYTMLQHFKGWVIRTDKNVFDSQVATLMDFRPDQKEGTTFVYVMPFSENEALVEYTIFSKELLNEKEYDSALVSYIEKFITNDGYEVIEQEFGVIPMTNYEFPQREGRIINIGTAGGNTKASSGYTFRFIQKHSAEIIKSLLQSETPYKNSVTSKRFRFYDSTLLNILHHRKLEGSKIFSDLFRKNKPQSVFQFLDNETNLFQELQIISSLPTGVFLKAGIQEGLRRKV